MNTKKGSLKAFISYAREDSHFLAEVKKYLTGLQDEGAIRFTTDCDISLADDWRVFLEREIADADLIIMLMTANFLASQECRAEVRMALAFREAKGTEVLPIILEPIPWRLEPIAHLQLFPRNGRAVPVAGRPRQECFTQFALQLAELARLKNVPFKPDASRRSIDLTDAANTLFEIDGVPQEDARNCAGKEFQVYGPLSFDDLLLSLEKSLALAERAVGPTHPDVAEILNRISLVLSEMGRPQAAIERLQRAESIWRANARGRLCELAVLLNNLGLAFQDTKNLSEARRLLERALILAQTNYGDENPAFAHNLVNLAGVLLDQKDAAGALDHITEALEIFGAKRVKDGLDQLLQARAEVLKGHALLALGRTKDAEGSFKAAFRFRVPGPALLPHLASAHTGLALAALAQGNLTSARHNLEEAVDLDERVYGLVHPSVAADRHNLGVVLAKLGQFSEARSQLCGALEILAQLPEGDHPRIAFVRAKLASIETMAA